MQEHDRNIKTDTKVGDDDNESGMQAVIRLVGQDTQPSNWKKDRERFEGDVGNDLVRIPDLTSYSSGHTIL
jgi:hypothetical protein